MATQFSGIEQRKHSRYDWAAPVKLVKDDAAVEGEIQNISMGGILVTTSMPLQYGDVVIADFMIPNLDKNICAQCTVRWTGGESAVGLSFVGLKAIETWAVSQLVRKLADG